eukprot:Rmarinus@m.15350
MMRMIRLTARPMMVVVVVVQLCNQMPRQLSLSTRLPSLTSTPLLRTFSRRIALRTTQSRARRIHRTPRATQTTRLPQHVLLTWRGSHTPKRKSLHLFSPVAAAGRLSSAPLRPWWSTTTSKSTCRMPRHGLVRTCLRYATARSPFCWTDATRRPRRSASGSLTPSQTTWMLFSSTQKTRLRTATSCISNTTHVRLAAHRHVC